MKLCINVVVMTGVGKKTGGCLCGAVRYEVVGQLRDVINCHCSMCQHLHGSFGAHSKADQSDIHIIEERGLKWFASSNRAERGFCNTCGSSLFWRSFTQSSIGILAGTLDQPTCLKVIGHIFVGEKADFVEITDDAMQYVGSSEGELKGDEL